MGCMEILNSSTSLKCGNHHQITWYYHSINSLTMVQLTDLEAMGEMTGQLGTMPATAPRKEARPTPRISRVPVKVEEIGYKSEIGL